MGGFGWIFLRFLHKKKIALTAEFAPECCGEDIRHPAGGLHGEDWSKPKKIAAK